MKDIKLQKGMTHMIQKTVAYEDTTLSFGRSGIETLFSTTSLVGMMIEVTVNLVGKNIPEGYITISRNMNIIHQKPTLQGMAVTAKAVLEEIEGNKLHFSITCYDEVGEIATGKLERHIVNQNALIKKAHERAEALEQNSR
ncbi:Predicted thioesterase [Natronincola peptidivorans]|uniref:Predicted thioesterase n=2 Tax=Natronincola peptidivorans TaxID=426128 RepID=A0A1I0DL19_9FIRM|nr:Predicted thioesterase [Natronincola peptidivorans]